MQNAGQRIRIKKHIVGKNNLQKICIFENNYVSLQYEIKIKRTMEKSLIGRRYVVKDCSYIKDLSGNCQFPRLYGQTCIIIHHPYTESLAY